MLRRLAPSAEARHTLHRVHVFRPGVQHDRASVARLPIAQRRRSEESAANHPVHVSSVGHALQLVVPGILEREATSCDEIPHRLRHADLGIARRCRDPSADGTATQPTFPSITPFTGVQSGSHLDAEVADALGDLERTVDASREILGRTEKREQPDDEEGRRLLTMGRYLPILDRVRRKKGVLIPIEAAILRCGVDLQRRGEPEFYGFFIAKELRDRDEARRLTAHGTLYKALDRLEKAGLVQSRWEDPEAAASERRPRRRFYQVTGLGERVATESRRVSPAPRPKPGLEPA